MFFEGGCRWGQGFRDGIRESGVGIQPRPCSPPNPGSRIPTPESFLSTCSGWRTFGHHGPPDARRSRTSASLPARRSPPPRPGASRCPPRRHLRRARLSSSRHLRTRRGQGGRGRGPWDGGRRAVGGAHAARPRRRALRAVHVRRGLPRHGRLAALAARRGFHRLRGAELPRSPLFRWDRGVRLSPPLPHPLLDGPALDPRLIRRSNLSRR